MTDNAFVLALLQERPNQWVAQADIIARSQAERGHGLTPHSRVADLRKDGHIIENRLVRDYNRYQRKYVGRVRSFYMLLDSGEVSLSASPESSGPVTAADDLTLPAADGTTAAGSLDTYGIDRAVAEANVEHPGMLVEPDRPLPLEEQRRNLAALQQQLFGDVAA